MLSFLQSFVFSTTGTANFHIIGDPFSATEILDFQRIVRASLTSLWDLPDNAITLVDVTQIPVQARRKDKKKNSRTANGFIYF